MKHLLHKENCTSKVRAVLHINGTTITLMGRHGFEWSIVQEFPGRTMITIFSNREDAKREFDKFK